MISSLELILGVTDERDAPLQVSYVLDTEDVFIRPRQPRPEAQPDSGYRREDRNRRFLQWLHAQQQQQLLQQQQQQAQPNPMAPILEATAA
jgi:hypothetical protein